MLEDRISLNFCGSLPIHSLIRVSKLGGVKGMCTLATNVLKIGSNVALLGVKYQYQGY